MRYIINAFLFISIILIHTSIVFAHQKSEEVNYNVDTSQEVQSEKSDRSISRGRFLTGGIAGTIAGFGLGHTIQGRYRSNRAWIFTAGEGAVAAYFIFGSLFGSSYCSRNSESSGCRNSNYQNNDMINNSTIPFLTTVFLGFKVWEIFDVWSYPKNTENRLLNSTTDQKETGSKYESKLGLDFISADKISVAIILKF